MLASPPLFCLDSSVGIVAVVGAVVLLFIVGMIKKK
ncbi:GlsB/YeaQ/YmgE family stress response membrane protein [Arenimonas sp.]